MAPGDRQPTSDIIQRPIPALDARKPPTMTEGPSGISQRASKLELIQLELRGLFPSRTRNTMFNPVTGGDEGRFFFALIGSFSSSRTFLFGDMEVTILSARQPTYIEPPHIVDGEKLRPLVAQYFVYGEVSPKTMGQDPRVSTEIHEKYAIEFSQGEEKKPKYLFPAQPKILNILHTISVIPSAPIAGATPEQASLLNLSAMEVYLPKSLDEARAILLKGIPIGENNLDLLKMHDSLESATQVFFAGEERKASLPFSILQVAGGAKYHLYPYGVSPPMGAIPEGCALVYTQGEAEQKLHYLILPEARIPALLARGLPPQSQESGVG